MKEEKIPIILDDQLLYNVFDELISNNNFNILQFELCKVDQLSNIKSKTIIIEESIINLLEQSEADIENIYSLVTRDKSENNSIDTKVIKIQTPFKIIDLIDQIYQGLNQASAQKDRMIILNKFKYDPSSRILSDGEISLRFTEKESQIFLCLANNNKRSLQKKELLDQIWNYGNEIDTHTLETHIYSLRKKIDERLHVKNVIRFEEKQGYSLAKSLL